MTFHDAFLSVARNQPLRAWDVTVVSGVNVNETRVLQITDSIFDDQQDATDDLCKRAAPELSATDEVA